MGQGDRQFQILPDRHAKCLGRVAVNGNFKRREYCIFGGIAQVINAQGQGDWFPDNGKGRRVAY